MKYVILLIVLHALTVNAGVIRNLVNGFLDEDGRDNPDVGMPTLFMLRRAGYPAEGYAVETEDGYLLTVHRIPKKGAPPVFIQHGLLVSSDAWPILGKEKSLVYLLSNAGYDVWLGNYRGNTYSRGHATLSTRDTSYWNFSWHEHGIYDLPAMLKFVTQKTNQTIFSYIGHSMGTTGFFVMCSERPEMMKLVNKMYALAPVAYLGHIRSFPLRMVLPFANDIQLISRLLGNGEFLPHDSFLKFVEKYGCTVNKLEERICGNILFTLAGYDTAQLNTSLIPSIVGHTPAGTSTKTVVHYSQLISSERFCQYDYGQEKNQEIYGTAEPPSYDLSNIKMPIGIIYADNDYLASPQDVALLHKQLPNVFTYYKVPFEAFNHLDFMWAKDADQLLYHKLIEMINEDRKGGKEVNVTPDPSENEV